MKKVIIYAVILIGVAYAVWTTYLWKFFKSSFAGSYPTAEKWNVPARQEELIAVIRQLKTDHPDLEPPHSRWPSFRDHSYWHLEYFHYSDTDEDIEIYLRPTEGGAHTILALTTIMQHTDSLTDFSNIVFVPNKDINRDYGYFENRKQINKFEERILNPILDKLDVKASD